MSAPAALAVRPVPLAEPDLSGNEVRYLTECIHSGYVSSAGAFVDRLERELAARLGVPHAVACASGTAALHTALRVAGAGPGALVAVADLTFIASANAAAYTGAGLLLVDADPATWCIDTHRLHAEVTRRARTGAPLPTIVEPVHLLGHPADLEPLLDLHQRYGIAIVEDAAQALGARYLAGPLAGRAAGTIGAGCLSFNGNKTITTGGGGAILTADATLAARCRHLSTQAKLPGPGYLHDEIGHNYRLSNLHAAVGTAQLERLDAILAAKTAIAQRYRDGLADLPITLPPHQPWAQPSWWLSTILLPDPQARDHTLAALHHAGIAARPVWAPVHEQPPYRATPRLGGRIATDLAARGLSLPSSPTLTDHDQQRVIAAVRAEVSAG